MGTTQTRARQAAEVPAPRSRSRRKPDAEVITEPVVEEPAEDLGDVNGVKIVRVEQVGNLPGAPFKGFVRLVLANGSDAYRCADCDFVATRGGVISHRQKEHGAGSAWATRVRRGEKAAATTAKKNPMDAFSEDVLNITMAEILQFAQDRAQLAQMIEDLTTQRDEWKNRALTAEMSERRVAAAFDRLGFRKIEEDEL